MIGMSYNSSSHQGIGQILPVNTNTVVQVRVISIRQNSASRSHRLRQVVHAPEAVRIAGPRSVRVTIEAVHNNDIHCRRSGGI